TAGLTPVPLGGAYSNPHVQPQIAYHYRLVSRSSLEDPHWPQYYADDCLRMRKRRMVTAPDRVLLTGSRSILPRPGDEKRMPSPRSTGSTYTRISSTSPRRRHW